MLITNHLRLYISSEVKSSEVYSHEVAWYHREDVTLECYLLPITLSPGLGCLLGTYRIQIWSKLRNRLRTITTVVIVGQKWVIMCPHVVQAQITTTLCTWNIWTRAANVLIILSGNYTPGRLERLRSVLSCHSLGFLLSPLCKAMLSCFWLGVLLPPIHNHFWNVWVMFPEDIYNIYLNTITIFFSV